MPTLPRKDLMRLSALLLTGCRMFVRPTVSLTLVAADVLEHLQSPSSAVRLLREYLKPDGRMIVSLPNVANYSIRLSLLRGHFDYGSNQVLASGHLHFFTRRSAMSLLANAGLVVEGVDVTPGLFLFQPYHATIERVFGRWRWHRHLEYLICHAWQSMLAFQFILEARKERTCG